MGINKYKRQTPRFEIRDKVLILCSGETEEIYFNNFKKKCKLSLDNVSVKVEPSKKSNPMAVVNAAIEVRSDYNEIWCVFDKDNFRDFDDAINKVRSYGNVFCAFSNEAIEYWFLLHFMKKHGAIGRSSLNNLLETKLGFEYNKEVKTIERMCAVLNKKNIEIAEQEAKVGHERHILNSGSSFSDWCSCTTVYMLTKRLREWSNARKK